MSERINKDRAKEILKEMKNARVVYLQDLSIVKPEKRTERRNQEVQALDIAIDSLQEDIQQKGIELMAKTIGRKHYYPMPTLFKNDDINKYTATEVNALIDSIADDIKKMLVEPYERKESKCQEEFDEELEILNGIYVED